MTAKLLVLPALPESKPLKLSSPEGADGCDVDVGVGSGIGVGGVGLLLPAKMTAKCAFILPSRKYNEEPIFSAVSLNISSTSPLESPGSIYQTSPAIPLTIGDETEVPDQYAYDEPSLVLTIRTPGAAKSTKLP